LAQTWVQISTCQNIENEQKWFLEMGS